MLSRTQPRPPEQPDLALWDMQNPIIDRYLAGRPRQPSAGGCTVCLRKAGGRSEMSAPLKVNHLSASAVVDVVDHLAGILPGSKLDALRRSRPETRENVQNSYHALFQPADRGTSR